MISGQSDFFYKQKRSLYTNIQYGGHHYQSNLYKSVSPKK